MQVEGPDIPPVRLSDDVDLNRVDFALGYYRHLVRLHDYVEHHWHEPIQLTDVAEAIGISPSRLSHLFLDKTGVSFSIWIRYERVSRAAALLRSDERSIGEVAYSVGYRSSRTFARSFRKVTGISPSEYRKRLEAQILSQS